MEEWGQNTCGSSWHEWGGVCVWGTGGQRPVLAPAVSELLGDWLLYAQTPRAPGSKAGLGQLPGSLLVLGTSEWSRRARGWVPPAK